MSQREIAQPQRRMQEARHIHIHRRFVGVGSRILSPESALHRREDLQEQQRHRDHCPMRIDVRSVLRGRVHHIQVDSGLLVALWPNYLLQLLSTPLSNQVVQPI